MTGYESKRAAAQDKLAQESVVERAWFTIDELNAWADKKLAENPHWVMPAEEPERKEALAQPPQRPWVDLTDDEIEDLFQSAAGADEETHIRFARAIENALRSKNT